MKRPLGIAAAIAAFALVAFALVSGSPSAAGNGAAENLVIRGATVLPMDGGAPIENAVVLIQGDRIAAVGPVGSIRIPADARVVRADGKYLIPGLWDSHAHVVFAGETGLAGFIGHGVTGVRDMGGNFETISSWRRRIDSGDMVGPRILTSGPVIESAEWLERISRIETMMQERGIPEQDPALLADFTRMSVATPEEARLRVRQLKAQGVDFIKFRNLPSAEVFRALMDEAASQGLKVGGHMPRPLVDLAEASGAMQTIEHAFGWSSLIEGDVAQRAATYAALRRPDFWITPTLATERIRTGSDADGEQAYAALTRGDALLTSYLSPRARGHLDRDWAIRREERREFPYSPRQAVRFEEDRSRLGEMHAAGVKMLAGTDVGAPGMVAGHSLHDELAELVGIGMSPLQALEAATSEPARALGRLDEFGTIAAGRAADLVLLDADPRTDITNTRRIAAVISRGRLYDARRLALLRDVASDMTAERP